ncbi:hypothetical protein COY93_00595 [Candidatus Uhrbacteria bacterium CG_4_10_14_0_8_um_filter_58_22]|uniref:GerMN domain-containing protein n=1 Tax=Candidatus Uhrbacteria bacterium CG_4_10_14_0_8_um_filter_58_22 TaxID=1975029 RepID=A0A2M7QBW6_9BACT|nr:MAG: hypothetical protein AUJ19_04140 [Parcubacteria group bacterium CG1_02_58_44]PIY63286.1 MAG: hypothetical protein COY93_00595 [Candidatus Uhrbacteria bacterium CG_4_10_14_0_8_um_filter_58_22]
MNTKRFAIVGLAALLLAGWGCNPKIQPTPLDQVSNDVDALQSAQELSAEEVILARRQNDLTSNLLPIAVVLTEGQEAPAEGVERLSDETFGCLDRIGYVRVTREMATDDVVADAISTLLASKEPAYGNLINSLWESTFKLDKVQQSGENGATTEVWISGEANSPGTCADPRIKEQIEATVRQYSPDYKIFLNGTEANWRCLGDLSGECK